jgi:hypothetical protein
MSSSTQSFTAAVVAVALFTAVAGGLAVATATEGTPVPGLQQPAPPKAGAAMRPVVNGTGHEDLIERLALGYPLEMRIAEPGQSTDLPLMSMAIIP